MELLAIGLIVELTAKLLYHNGFNHSTLVACGGETEEREAEGGRKREESKAEREGRSKRERERERKRETNVECV